MEEGREFGRRILLHGRQGMGVDVERDLDPLMAEPLLHHLDRLYPRVSVVCPV